MLKFAIIFYLKRITDNIYKASYAILVKVTYGYLALTFLAAVISNITECTPFSRYWAVGPDIPGQCRQGFAQLITMAAGNVTSDLVLVILPLPIVWSSKLGRRKQVQISALFCLSLVPVGVTLFRVPSIIGSHGAQAHRSLWASIEILSATSAANALVLGTFMRDRGTKKNKYKFGSGETIDRRRSTLRTRDMNLHKRWGSDEDLVRDLGLSVSRGMWEEDVSDLTSRPLPVAKFSSGPYLAATTNNNTTNPRAQAERSKSSGKVNKSWRFPARHLAQRSHGGDTTEETDSMLASASQTGLAHAPGAPPMRADASIDSTEPVPLIPERSANGGLAFFDVGNLLKAEDSREDLEHGRPRTRGENQDGAWGDGIIKVTHSQTHTQTHHPRTSSSSPPTGTFITISAGRSRESHLSPHPGSGYDPASQPSSSTQDVYSFADSYSPGDASQPRSRSSIFLQDIGGLVDGPPISVHGGEVAKSPLSPHDPLGAKNALEAAKDVLSYWDREKGITNSHDWDVSPLTGGSAWAPVAETRLSPGSRSSPKLRPGESVELQTFDSSPSISPGGHSYKKSASPSGHGIKSALSLPNFHGKEKRKEKEERPVLHVQMNNEGPGDEEQGMELSDIGGLLK